MPDPMSRLEVTRQEIDRVFGAGHANSHPELVIAVMNAASTDWAASRLAAAIEAVAIALVEEEEDFRKPEMGIVRARGGLVRP